MSKQESFLEPIRGRTIHHWFLYIKYAKEANHSFLVVQ